MLKYVEKVFSLNAFNLGDIKMGKRISDLLPIVDSYAERIIEDALGSISIPVDIEKIAEFYGIQIFRDEMSEGESGAIVINQSDCGMLINQNDHTNRQRFTIAHEIGHFVSYKYQGQTGERIDFRNLESSFGKDLEEIFANKFAAAILMPISIISEIKNRSKIELANEFNVSTAAIENRIKNVK